MEEQRSIQMKTITSDEKLEAYYLSFKKLFTILYQASHIIDENIFKKQLCLKLDEKYFFSFSLLGGAGAVS